MRWYRTIWCRFHSRDQRMKAVLAAVFRLPQRVLMVMVKAYRLMLSPWLGNQCRFEPSCSVYALHALEQHGALAGTYLTLFRVARCQPWCDGGHDPVPQKLFFTRLFAHPSQQHSSSEKKSS